MCDRMADVGPAKPFKPDLASSYPVKPLPGSPLAEDFGQPNPKDYADPHAFQAALTAYQLGIVTVLRSRLRPTCKADPDNTEHHSHTFYGSGPGENR